MFYAQTLIIACCLQVLDKELKNMESPVAQELEFVRQIVAEQPPHVPAQLLRALEKDARNLEKSLNSIRDLSQTRVKHLQSMLEQEKVSIINSHIIFLYKYKYGHLLLCECFRT